MSKVKSYWPVCLVIFSYILLLICYLQDIISGHLFIGTLFLELIAVSIWLSVQGYRKRVSRKSLLAVGVLWFIIGYEQPVVNFSTHTFNVKTYNKPKEIVEGSNLYMMIENTVGVPLLENEGHVRNIFVQESNSVVNIYPIDNKDRYRSKNIALQDAFGLHETAFETMYRKAKEYFGEEELHVQSFFERDDIDGDSVGLVLGLSELFARNEMQNTISIGVTGTLEGNGDVRGIEGVKEKVQIATQSSLHYLIVPRENFEEAEAENQSLQLKLQIFAVGTIDEAKQVIQELNQP
ncbi:S16 family serine protease [Lysinibacillus sp. NPDC097287]|uniref:S16 family serine protease n=1 Tax=Lysinibacillus sp. NPDC097287 TaxID=3364144 RepID=UPI00382BE806